MIRLQNVTKSYVSGTKLVTTVQDVTLHIERGEVFGIIGYSGAGKSSLLRCINLLERPSSGQVYVGNQDMTALTKRDLQTARAKIGMIFQHFHLLHSATVAENIAFPLRLAKVSKREAMKKVSELLELVGLAGYEHQYPSQLSGGQKQRVAIARALANDPSVLLCDEATSALDPETTRSILELLLDLHQRLDLTIVLVTHQMSVIRRVCDRVAVMDQGAVVELGSVADVFLNPKHTVTERLVQSEEDQNQVGYTGEDSVPLLDITFVGDSTYQPVLARVAKATDSSFSILQGNIGTLKNVPYGKLRVAWYSDKPALPQVISALRAEGCTVRIYNEQPVLVEV